MCIRDRSTWARLFLVPGMNHCAGGPATDSFDGLGAIVDWVEKGTAPARIEASARPGTTYFAGRTRPLCPYPSAARYKGTGNLEDGANFECAVEPAARGLYNWIHSTGDAERSFAFYRDVFGIELARSPFAGTASANARRAPVVTIGGVPLDTPIGRAMLVRDPDGYLVEVRQASPTAVAAAKESG